MHGRMHPNYGLATILLAHDPLSSSTYPRIPHVASNLPIKTLVARQQPTLSYTVHCVVLYIAVAVIQ